MRAVLDGPIVVLPRHDEVGTVDVFTGNGWGNYTQFQVHGGKIKLIKGKAMSGPDFRNFKTMVK